MFQAAEAQGRVSKWQAEYQQQQTALQSALKLVQEHLQTSIQACRSRLSQLQHWLSHPGVSLQQDTLSRHIQEAEQQLAQLRQEAQQCESDVYTITQQQTTNSQKTARISNSVAAGTAPAGSSNSNQDLESNPAARSWASEERSASGSNGSSTEGMTRTGGGAASHGWASSGSTNSGRSGLMQSAQSSRGQNLWQPASHASTSTATATVPAPVRSALDTVPVVMHLQLMCYYSLLSTTCCLQLVVCKVCRFGCKADL